MTDLVAFDLGLNCNTLLWHFDQATFGLNLIHRANVGRLIVRMRALSNVSPQLSGVLQDLETWLTSVGDQWFHEQVEEAQRQASFQRGDPSSSDVYYQTMRPMIPDYRDELQTVIAVHVLQTPRQRLLFAFGMTLDQGRHSPEVARHLLGGPAASHPACGFSEQSWSDALQPNSPEIVLLHQSRAGELPPPLGWQEQILEYRTQVGLPTVPHTPAEAEVWIDHVRQCLRVSAGDGALDDGEHGSNEVISV